jgi:hypothetical protein
MTQKIATSEFYMYGNNQLSFIYWLKQMGIIDGISKVGFCKFYTFGHIKFVTAIFFIYH